MQGRSPRTPAEVVAALPRQVQRSLAPALGELARALGLTLPRALALLQRDPDFALRRVQSRLARATPYVRARYLRPLERLALKLRGGAQWSATREVAA